ncbi:ERF family protein [uncultured Campylobacter sp.]|uniref:ERF family protein n=1 Tax=uncultured Campylobacter sp. TaxID=218934 RepID=UPI002624F179|nr:ERF family protein [uncultured Campylobacter sp.]
MLEILNKIQCELKAPKTQINKFGGYAYRSCEDILEAVKPLLQKYEAVLTIGDEIIAVADRIYVKATATLKGKDGEVSVSAYAREPASKKGSDESQITGAASSYARKYALNGLFAIDDAKDADATNIHEDARDKKGEYPAPMSEEQVADLLQLCEASGTDPRKVAAAYKTSDIAFVPFEKVRAQLLQKLAKAQEVRKGA